MRTVQDKKAQKKKLLELIITIAINVLIVGYIAVMEFGSEAKGAPNLAALDVNLRYLLLALACFVLALLMETLKYKSMMIASEGRYDTVGAFECALLGKYYDNITPLGAGGQPFQIYYLKKRGLSTGSSAALPIAGFLGLQLAFVLIAAVVFIFNGSVTDSTPAIRVSAYIGLAFYLFVPICIILFAIIPNTFGKMVSAVAKILSKLHIVKNYDKAVGGIFSSLGEYTQSLKMLSIHPHLLFKVIFFSVIYQLAIMTIPFYVLRAFGGTSDWWTVFSLVVFIYAAITIIPTPGNAGAAEGSFYAVFSSLTSAYLFWAMIIWRLLVYYSWLLLGLLLFAKSAVGAKHLSPKRPLPKGNLRVAQFVDIYYPHIDGVITTVDAYAKRMNSGGDYCCVVVPRAGEPYEDSKEYDVVRTAAIRFPGVDYLLPAPLLSKKLRRFIENGNFDVFHVHSPFFEGEFAIRMGRRLGIPVIATFHSKFYDDVLSITHSRFLARMVTNHVVKFFSKADAVWACSESTAETLRSYGFHGEIDVMENGVDVQEIPNPEALRQRAVSELELPEDKRILLFVGQQIWQKGLRLILDTVKLLKEQEDEYYTVIAGEGYNAEAIKKYAASLGLGDSVKFTGQITDRELLSGLFLASDLFFFPSEYDNAPLVLREAALVGVPSLLTEGSNSAECVRDGINGFTEQPSADKMAAKIRSAFASEKLSEVGQKAKETIPLAWETIVSRAQSKYRLASKRSYEPVDIRQAAQTLEEEERSTVTVN